MEGTIKIHIEKLPEGVFLAASEDIQGLVAQGRTVAETIEIARDVAKRLLETQNVAKDQIKKIAHNYSKPFRRYARRYIKGDIETSWNKPG